MNASLRYGLTTAATAIIVLGLAVVVELISYRNPVRKDFTANARHSLAEQTVQVLQGLDQPVRLIFFIKRGDPAKIAVQDVLDIYRYHSAQFSYEMIDPDMTPGRARDYNLEQYSTPVAFFETDGDKRESVTGIRGTDGLEELLTNALVRVTRGRIKRIYVLTGHGEATLEEGTARSLRKARAALEDKSYLVEPLQLLGLPRVPADCDVLLVAGPMKELDPTELQAVRRYLETGGRAFFAIEPQTSQGLAAVAGQFGFTVGDDVVIDFNMLNRLAGGSPLVPIVGQYGKHAITRNFKTATYYPEARSIEPQVGGDIQPTVLAQTSADSFAETNYAEILTGRVAMDGADRRGPITIGAAAEWPPRQLETPAESADAGSDAEVEDGAESTADGAVEPDAVTDAVTDAEPMEDALDTVADADLAEDAPERDGPAQKGRLVVFGDSDFFSDQHFEAMGNADMFLNVVNWLGQEEDLIAVRPKSSDAQYVTLTAGQARMAFLLPVVILPGAVLATGVAVWWRRKRAG